MMFRPLTSFYYSGKLIGFAMQSFLHSQSVISSLSDESQVVQAIFNKDTDELKSLIYNKEDLNTLDADRRTPLHAAAYLGDAEIINLLVLSGARINAKDSRWLTPLHRACASRSVEAVSALIKHQADVNARDKLWQSPLHIAAANDSVACAELLIPQLSNLNFSDRAGRQAIHHAVFNGHINIVNILIKHDVNIHAYDRQERRAIHWAAYMGHSEIIKILVANGAEINCRDKKNGDTPMHAAAAAGQISAVKILLDLEFDINTQNNQKCTALHLACFNGQDVVVHELLESGADHEIRNIKGCTPLHYAAASTHGALCLELLVNHGADVNVISNDGQTPLHMTAVHGRFTRSQTLLQSGSRVDYVDKKGNTALHVAARHGHELLVATLLEAGSDPSKHGSGGKIPLHLAALYGHVNCSKKLLTAHASDDSGPSFADVIGFCDKNGRCALHYAACGGALECIDVFLSYMNVVPLLLKVDACGRTPLHYALSSARKECARRLITTLLQRTEINKDFNDADNDKRTLLHHAAASDVNAGCVELLLDQKVNVLAVDNVGYTPLHYAAACGHEVVVKLLVDANRSILSRTHEFEATVPSPLHLASYNGHVSVVMFLAEYLLELDNGDNEGRTAMELAAFQGNFECVQALLMQGARITQTNTKTNSTPLHAAAFNGHTKCLQTLVEGAMRDAEVIENKLMNKFINARDCNKCTPLMYAVTNGHLKSVEFLLSRNAQVWPVDKFGCTALHRGAIIGHEDIVKTILHYSKQQTVRSRYSTGNSNTSQPNQDNVLASLVARTHNGRTCLHFAAIRGNATMLETLLQDSPVVNTIDRYGYTPLHYACFEGHEPCVDAILLHDSFTKFEGSAFSPLHCAVYNDNEACADRLIETLGDTIVLLKDNKGSTALHASVLGDNTDCCLFLLSHGCDIDSTNVQGQSPLMLASLMGHENSVELLVNSKADCGLVDVDNNNCLHLACLKDHESCAVLLLDNIDDLNIINAQNNCGQTPLHIAARNGHVSSVMELLKKAASVDTTDNDGFTPALACAPNNNVADCLDMIISVMLKFSTQSRESGSFDLSSIKETLEDSRQSQEVRKSSLLKRQSEKIASPPVQQRTQEEDTDSETY